MKKIKILFITQSLSNQEYGGAQKTTQNLRLLTDSGYEVHVCGFTEKKPLPLNTNTKIFTIYKPIIQTTVIERLQHTLSSLFSHLPARLQKFNDPKLTSLILKLQQKHHYTATILDHTSSLIYAPIIHSKKIYFEHNVEHVLIKSRLITAPLVTKPFWLVEYIRTYFFEKKFLNQVDYIFAICSKDAEAIKQLSGKKAHILPHVVGKAVKPSKKPLKNWLVFSGLLSWFENYRGLAWFIQNCYPEIKTVYPKIKLVVTGLNPTPELKRLFQTNNIEYKGFVKNIESIYWHRPVAISPMFANTGVHMKNFTYMKHNLAIVATTNSTRGFPHHNMQIAKDRKEFTLLCLKLLKDQKLRNQVGVQGGKIINTTYNQKLPKKLKNIIEK